MRRNFKRRNCRTDQKSRDKELHHTLLQSFVASRVIPLNKDPGRRPIGVGEVLRRIIGKAVSWTLKEEFCEAAGPLQTCAGHMAGAEAAIHGIRAIFEKEETDAVLLIDASNAFNRMNRKVAMHNIRITCPEVSVYIINMYRHPSRLFISGGGEISSQEGTTEGDPLAMPWYAVNTRTLIDRLRITVPEVKQAWLADDSARGELLAAFTNGSCNLVPKVRSMDILSMDQKVG